MKKIRSCGFLIYREQHPDNKSLQPGTRSTLRSFLLMKHPNRWDLPKGHLDPGESNLQCALRELEEETGILDRDIEVDTGFEYSQDYEVIDSRYGPEPQSKNLVIYLARLLHDVEIQLTEHSGYEWFAWDPPHQIQPNTIDPLLNQLADHWG